MRVEKRKKLGPIRRFRRWKRRMMRRHKWALLAIPLGEAMAGCLAALLLIAAILMLLPSRNDAATDPRTEAQTRLMAANATEAPTKAPTAVPTEAPVVQT